MRHLLFAAILIAAPVAARADETLQSAIAAPQRSPAFVARDSARHPAEELAFFGIQPTMTVVELWPSGGYWTQILAPYLHDYGNYIAALPLQSEGDGNAKFKSLIASDPRYDKVHVAQFGPGAGELAASGTVDAVLTFRNLHNWMAMGTADAALGTIWQALKPGGILGVEDHRGLASLPQDAQTKDGYVREDVAIALIEQAGFEFVGTSPINDNPRDTKQWPKGVWTLPPSYRLGDQDRAKYEAIGEADNFTLLFRKPAK